MPLTPLSQSDYENLTRAHWLSAVPDAEDVSITVRDRAGKPVRFLLITRDGAVVIDPAACLENPSTPLVS